MTQMKMMTQEGRKAGSIHLRDLRAVLLCALCVSAVHAQTYPTFVWPPDSSASALSGTVDQATGLPYIGRGTNLAASTPLDVQYYRREQRLNQMLDWQGFVGQTAALRIGVRPLHYTLGSTFKTYNGGTGIGSGTLDAGDDTYYVYIDSGNSLQVVADGTGWPADEATFVPLAEVTVVSSAITGITDRRGWARYVIPQTGGASATGTDEQYYTIDADNAGAGADLNLFFNRGSTAADAALKWDETNDRFDLVAESSGPTLANVRALSWISTVTTGTAPLTVASTTKVTNLNADSVDGLGFGAAPAAANALPYSTSTSAIGWTAAASSGDVLYANAGVPTWAAPGATSGVQGYDADLAAIAALASTGLIARTGTGTASARTITAGDSAIAVTNGSGASGNPTIALTGMTQYAVAVGTSGGSLATLSAASDNTVMVGNTGANPSFRKIVNADINSAAAIHYSKIDFGTFLTQVVGEGPTFSVGTETSNTISVEIFNPENVYGDTIDAPLLMDIWLGDDGTEATLSSTAATSLTISTGALLETVTSAKHVRAASSESAGSLIIDIEYTGGAKTWYLKVSIAGRIWSQVVTFS